jgi:hypothetical protein
MVDIVSKRCMHNGCKTMPVFAFPRDARPSFCAAHKQDAMVDIVSKRCLYEGCIKHCAFGFAGDTKPSFCAAHKHDKMVNVKSKMCLHEGCRKHPNFGLPEDARPSFCATHKQDAMVDIKSKKCIHDGCTKQPTFGLPNDARPSFCVAHKKAEMVDLRNTKCPGVPGVSETCPYDHQGNKKYDYYCTACFAQAFPLDPRTFLIHKNSYELIVRDYLNKTFPDLGLVHDKSLWTHNCDCTHKRRIDLRTLIGNTLLCIEVDEHQHKDRDEKDEELRYDDVYMLHSGKFIFIRFNPHPFKDASGRRRNPDMAVRLGELSTQVALQLARIRAEANTELLEVHKLYFDGC